MAETTTDRPTFEQALESAGASVTPETPAATPVAAPTEAAPTAPPATPASPDEDWSPSAGPIPFDRHKAILENARKKAREEAEAGWKDYGWAKEIKREQLEEWGRIAAEMHADPIAFYKKFGSELGGHPTFGPMLRSEAARMLAAARTNAPPEDPEPQPDLELEDGRKLYSAARQAEREKWFRRQISQDFKQELKPLVEEREQRQAQEQERQVQDWATQTLTDAREHWHGFKEHEAEVKDQMLQHEDWTLERAYLHVFHATILPTLTQKEAATAKAEVLDDLKTRAAASSLNPSAAVPATPKRPRTFEEAFAQRGLKVD